MKTVEMWKTLLRSGVRSAMRAGDRHALTALRDTLAAIDNAEALPIGNNPVTSEGRIAGSRVGLGAGDAPRRELSPEAVLALVEQEVGERRGAAAAYAQMGRASEARVLTMQAALLEGLVSTSVPARTGPDASPEDSGHG
ncbi:MAG TPA: hypothetical protein VK013_00295 [Myxococcaceae bacterium]|nr:hypothetical protein [Myxococcaceae bacterium]